MISRHVLVHTPFLSRPQHVWAYGHAGPPLLVFPSAAGFAHEWHHHGMVEALSPLINSGKLRLYCPESNVSMSWTDKKAHAAERMKHHQSYERFILETFLPQVRADSGLPEGAPVHCAGTSLGGMYAALFALKFPQAFSWALCMSGRYLATVFTGGFSNMDVYFNNPLVFVPGLKDDALDRVKQTHLVLVCGQGKWEEGCIEETIALADLCAAKGIPHTRDIWGRDSVHDWDWWRKQAALHIGRRFGGPS